MFFMKTKTRSMKKVAVSVAFALLTLSGLLSCSKGGSGGGGGGGGGGGTNEVNLAVTLDPPVNSVQAPSLGPFSVKVSVTSTMPPQGVKIDVSAKKDDGSGSAAFFTNSTTTSTAVTTMNINSTPVSSTNLVTVTVTSVSKSSNTWTGTYRYARK
jgi:hypothetical protein